MRAEERRKPDLCNFVRICTAVSVCTYCPKQGGRAAQRKAVTKLGDLSGSGTIFDSLPPEIKRIFRKVHLTYRNNAIINPCANFGFYAPIVFVEGEYFYI